MADVPNHKKRIFANIVLGILLFAGSIAGEFFLEPFIILAVAINPTVWKRIYKVQTTALFLAGLASFYVIFPTPESANSYLEEWGDLILQSSMLSLYFPGITKPLAFSIFLPTGVSGALFSLNATTNNVTSVIPLFIGSLIQPLIYFLIALLVRYLFLLILYPFKVIYRWFLGISNGSTPPPQTTSNKTSVEAHRQDTEEHEKTPRPDSLPTSPDDEIKEAIEYVRSNATTIKALVDGGLGILSPQKVIAAEIAKSHPKGRLGVQRTLEAVGLQDFKTFKEFLSREIPEAMSHPFINGTVLPKIGEIMHLLVRYICDDPKLTEAIDDLDQTVIRVLKEVLNADDSDLDDLKIDEILATNFEHNPSLAITVLCFVFFFQSGLGQALRECSNEADNVLSKAIEDDFFADALTVKDKLFSSTPDLHIEDCPSEITEGISVISRYLAREITLAGVLDAPIVMDFDELEYFLTTYFAHQEDPGLDAVCLAGVFFFFNKAFFRAACDLSGSDAFELKQAFAADFNPRSSKFLKTSTKLGIVDLDSTLSSAGVVIARGLVSNLVRKIGLTAFSYAIGETAIGDLPNKMPTTIKVAAKFGETSRTKPEDYVASSTVEEPEPELVVEHESTVDPIEPPSIGFDSLLKKVRRSNDL